MSSLIVEDDDVQGAPAASNWMQQITVEPEKLPSTLLLYGEPGGGKSSMIAAAPDVLFIAMEDGIQTLKTNLQVRSDVPVLPAPQTWLQFLEMLREFRTSKQKHPYKRLAIDALGGVEDLLVDHVVATEYAGKFADNKTGFMAWGGQGYKSLTPHWRMFLNEITALKQAGIQPIMIAHDGIVTRRSARTQDRDKEVPKLSPEVWALTEKHADMVLYLAHETEIDDTGKHAKGKSSDERFLFTCGDASFSAKNRHGLPPTISAGGSGEECWANLIKALKAARKESKHNV